MQQGTPIILDEDLDHDVPDMPPQANFLTTKSLEAEGFDHAAEFMARTWAASIKEVEGETRSRYRGIGGLVLAPIPTSDFCGENFSGNVRMFVSSANKLNQNFTVISDAEYIEKYGKLPTPQEYAAEYASWKSENEWFYDDGDVPEEQKVDVPESFLSIPARSGVDFLWDHAEESAIAKAEQNDMHIKGGILFTTKAPCTRCAQKIYEAGIKRVIVHERGFNSGRNNGVNGMWVGEAAKGQEFLLSNGVQYDIWPNDLPMDPKVKDAGELRKGKIYMIGEDGLLPDYDNPTYTLGEQPDPNDDAPAL